MDRFPRGSNESQLLQSDVGYAVLDAIVQANVDLNRLSTDELNWMVGQFATQRDRKAVARLAGVGPRSLAAQPPPTATA